MILKTTTKYFDAEEHLAAYEQLKGKPMSKNSQAIIREVEAHINAAYEAGYRDGQEAAHD